MIELDAKVITPLLPPSIWSRAFCAERTAALGGQAPVERTGNGGAVVGIEIPMQRMVQDT